MLIIAFGHRKQVGKDTAADFLMTHLRTTMRNKLIKKTGFASKMKSICHELYGWAGLRDEDYYEQHPELRDVKLPYINKSPRDVWIELGTTVGRAIYVDTWLDHVFSLKCDVLIIKDTRFPNEGDRVLAANGLLFRVDNPRVPHTDDKADSAMANYDKWTEVLINDGSLQDFNKKVIAAVQRYI